MLSALGKNIQYLFKWSGNVLPIILSGMLVVFGLQGCSSPNDLDLTDSSHTFTAPVQLKVGEGFINPIGYYEARPRFSWQLNKHANTQFQTAYQIQVASAKEFLSSHMLWDSLKVSSDKNAWIPYQGTKLSSRQKVYWRVKIWDELHQPSDWSESASVELGLLNNNDWTAFWIGHPDTTERDKDTIFNSSIKDGRFPVPNNKYQRTQYLRRIFELSDNIMQARLYITSKGVFKPYINGVAISQDLMTPGWTPYHKRIETLTYDVTSYLVPGKNVVGAILGEGWHSGRIFHPTEQQYIPPMRLIAQLEVSYQDGSVQRITSDQDWLVSNQGPIREASNYDGEVYDANFELKNWNTKYFIQEKSSDKITQTRWKNVVVEQLESQVKLQPKRHVAVRSTMSILPVSIVSERNGVTIFDMGQNMVGVPKLTIPVINNQQVKVRFAEALDNGQFAVANLRSAKATDIYIPSSSGTIEYQPTFTFHGYRFVELSGYDRTHKPSLDWLKGEVLHSDFEVYDNFVSDDRTLNKLSENVSWGLRGNFLDIPTDCPQRDERLGWTGDAQVFVQTSLYKADVYGFWAAWLQSVREEQNIDGLVPNFVPFRPFLTSLTGAAWGDAATIVPWELYQFTGDESILRDNYTMMKRWLGYHTFNSNQHISTMGSYGDWLQPFGEEGKNGGDTNKDLIATAYYAHAANIVAKSARILGFNNDATQFETLFSNIKRKFRDYFFDQNMTLNANITKPPVYSNGSERTGKPVVFSPKATQTTYLLPLAFDLFEPNDQNIAVSHLLELINMSERHLGTGFLGTPLLAPVLQKFGHSDVMYDLLFKDTYPSWFYSIRQGATTTWERWDSYSLAAGFNGEKMNSLNHYAYGAVASWFYRGILGIKQTTPGFQHFTISPQFNLKLGHASGHHATPHGDIIVSWSIKNTQLTMSLTVPKNTQAKLELSNIDNIQVIQNGVLIADINNELPPGSYQISGLYN
ncbi:alpha-L-rhamnosidase [Paraglaciecola sp.]|uniref:alpha-L-rhamnosidase n=1 Tax=Paraglaciecola sp. TaxID=1920173 RepID=UPI00273EBEA5|nr:alpha-L-rhamnosidase [Paraglaciecola sp.]MDP5033194.1 glycoside hydrolase family 78 protein [Paraglaciecola sp.]